MPQAKHRINSGRTNLPDSERKSEVYHMDNDRLRLWLMFVLGLSPVILLFAVFGYAALMRDTLTMRGILTCIPYALVSAAALGVDSGGEVLWEVSTFGLGGPATRPIVVPFDSKSQKYAQVPYSQPEKLNALCRLYSRHARIGLLWKSLLFLRS